MTGPSGSSQAFSLDLARGLADVRRSVVVTPEGCGGKKAGEKGNGGGKGKTEKLPH